MNLFAFNKIYIIWTKENVSIDVTFRRVRETNVAV